LRSDFCGREASRRCSATSNPDYRLAELSHFAISEFRSRQP
jgi:hypothetical protein